MLIFQVSPTEVSETDMPGWYEVIKGRKLQEMTICDFGMGDVCLALMRFETAGGEPDEYEVGAGGALRPYHSVYKGTDPEEASQKFAEHLAFLMGWAPEEDTDEDDDGDDDEDGEYSEDGTISDRIAKEGLDQIAQSADEGDADSALLMTQAGLRVGLTQEEIDNAPTWTSLIQMMLEKLTEDGNKEGI